MSSKKQTWIVKHPLKQGARAVEIIRYSNPDKVLVQIFNGCVPDGFEVLLNTANKIELTLDGEMDFYLEPMRS